MINQSNLPGVLELINFMRLKSFLFGKPFFEMEEKSSFEKKTIHKTRLPRGEGRGHSILPNKRIGLKYISNPTNTFCIIHYILASKSHVLKSK